MASRKKPIDPDTIDLLGKAKAARLVETYAEQQGAAAAPFLEKAFHGGSAPVRAAAAAALARVDVVTGERVAREALDALLAQGTPLKKELVALVECVALQQTPSALDHALDVMLRHKLDVEHLSALPAAALASRAFVRGRDTLARKVVPLHFLQVAEGPRHWAGTPLSVDDARAFLCAVFDDDALPLPQRQAAARILWTWGDAASIDELVARIDNGSSSGATSVTHVLGKDLAVAVHLRRAPALAYEALRESFASDGYMRARIADALGVTGPADPRWLDAARAHGDSDPRSALLVLARNGAREEVLAAARKKPLDLAVRHALDVLGVVRERRAAPLLLAWLETAEGEAYAPMLLNALGECGAVEDIARIEALPVREGRAAFYATCVQRIRENAAAAEAVTEAATEAATKAATEAATEAAAVDASAERAA